LEDQSKVGYQLAGLYSGTYQLIIDLMTNLTIKIHVVVMVLTIERGVGRGLYESVRKMVDARKVYRLGLSGEIKTLILS